jgi:hypothetical protein
MSMDGSGVKKPAQAAIGMMGAANFEPILLD